MHPKKYLIWLDILGFKELVERIAEESCLEERKVRTDFINVINERVAFLESQQEIMGKNYGERDDWLLVTGSLDSVFKAVYAIIDHNTGYKKHKRIPLEIAVGIGEYDRWARFDGAKLIVENSTVDNLKMNIVKYYHRWYIKNNNESPKSTFVILTRSAYDTLEVLDRKMCEKIEYKNEKKDEIVTFFVSSEESFQRRGKIFEFLEKIESPGSRLYYRIDELYVPPIEYEEIKQLLNTERIIFITGPAEYGKTYTAIRLLWEFFNDGYYPIWRASEGEWERREVRRRILDIERELKPRHVIYFEDPFGKIEYEKSETLEREIGSIIQSIKNIDDVFVIITSREKVFKEFKKEHLSSTQLKEFEKMLHVRKPSYGYERRREILLKRAESRDCQWFHNAALRDFVLDYMKDRAKLPTPLCIKDFVDSTVDILEEDELTFRIGEKSKETAKSFAKEIKAMEDDLILFLSFPFISSFPIDFVRKEYNGAAKKLEVGAQRDFEKIFSWFKDDKITVKRGRIWFSHPSYSEAIKHLLVEDGHPTLISKKIFSRLLYVLSQRKEAFGAVANAIKMNFDRLPEDLRNELLFKLSRTSHAAVAVAETVIGHFSEIPKDVQKIIFQMARGRTTASAVAWVVAAHYHDLPENVQQILFKLSEQDKAAQGVAWGVAANYDDLPKNVRNLLSEMQKKSGTAKQIPLAIATYYYKLPTNVQQILFKLSDRDDTAEAVIRAVKANSFRFPKNVLNALLLKLSERDRAAYELVKFVAAHYYDLPENVQQILFKLSERDSTAKHVAWALGYYDHLPANLLNELLPKLSERKQTARAIGSTIEACFDRLPEDQRNPLLLRLSEKGKAAWGVAWVVAAHYYDLPENVQQILFKLSKGETSAAVIRAVIAHFNNLPKKVQQLAFVLSENDRNAWILSKALAKDFDKLPEEVQKLFFKLAENENMAWAAACAIVECFDILPEEVRKLLFSLSEKDEAAWAVAWALWEYFNCLPEDVRNTLLLKLSEKDRICKEVVEYVETQFYELPGSMKRFLVKLRLHEYKLPGMISDFAEKFSHKLPKGLCNELLSKTWKR